MLALPRMVRKGIRIGQGLRFPQGLEIGRKNSHNLLFINYPRSRQGSLPASFYREVQQIRNFDFF